MASWSREVIPSLCSDETPPEVLWSALEFSPQEKYEPVGAGPEEGTIMIRGMEHLSYENSLRELRLLT